MIVCSIKNIQIENSNKLEKKNHKSNTLHIWDTHIYNKDIILTKATISIDRKGGSKVERKAHEIMRYVHGGGGAWGDDEDAFTEAARYLQLE